MREYEGFGGNVLFLDSKKIIARTQYIEEECMMDRIYDSSFSAPNFTKNGCLSITTENNVIPIYFLPKQSGAMIEAFGIIDALVPRSGLKLETVTGKQGEKLGNAKCTKAGHPILRNPGRMTLFAVPGALRCEYLLVDQGCTIPFGKIMQISVLSSRGQSDLFYDVGIDGNIIEDGIRDEYLTASIAAGGSAVGLEGSATGGSIAVLCRSRRDEGCRQRGIEGIELRGQIRRKAAWFFRKRKISTLSIVFECNGERSEVKFEGKDNARIGRRLAEAAHSWASDQEEHNVILDRTG